MDSKSKKNFNDTPKLGNTMQRILDIFFSGIAIIVLSPILIPVICLLRITGEGEVLYKQTSNTQPGEFLGRLVLGEEDNLIKIFGATIY